MPFFFNRWQSYITGSPNQVTRVNAPAGGKLLSFVQGFDTPNPGGVGGDWGTLLEGHDDLTLPGVQVNFEEIDTVDNPSSWARAYETNRVSTSRDVLIHSRIGDGVHEALINAAPDNRFTFRHVMPFPYCDLVHTVDKLAGITGATMTRTGGRVDTVSLRPDVPAVSIPGGVYAAHRFAVNAFSSVQGVTFTHVAQTHTLRTTEADMPDEVVISDGSGQPLFLGTTAIPLATDDRRRVMILTPGVGYVLSQQKEGAAGTADDVLSSITFVGDNTVEQYLDANPSLTYVIIWDFPEDRGAV